MPSRVLIRDKSQWFHKSPTLWNNESSGIIWRRMWEEKWRCTGRIWRGRGECNRIAVAWSWMGATRERNGSGRRIQEGKRPSSQWLPNTVDHSVKPIWDKSCLIIIKDIYQIDMKLQYHIMVHCIICFVSWDRQIILQGELFQTILQLEKSTNQPNKQTKTKCNKKYDLSKDDINIHGKLNCWGIILL